MNTFPIRYFADLNPGTGYNNAARGYVNALATLGIDRSMLRLIPAIQADLHAADLDIADPLERYMIGDWKGDEGRDRINIVHLPPTKVADFHTSLEGRYNIAITAWETDRLPEQSVEALRQFDEIWVPTLHNKGVFDAPVFKYDGKRWPQVHLIPHVLLGCARKPPEAQRSRDTEFYTIGAWNARKDPARLLRAYLATGWKASDPVQLQLYCVPPTRDLAHIQQHGYLAQFELRGLIDSVPNPLAVPSYGLHTTYVSYTKVLDRHLSGDVFVTASHGEGFCLPAIEAIASGNWVIGGGPWLEDIDRWLDLGDESPIVKLPTRKVPITPMPEVAGYDLDHEWWEVEIKALADEMRAAHEARLECGPARNEAAAKKARKMFSPQSIGQLIALRLEHANSVLAGSGW